MENASGNQPLPDEVRKALGYIGSIRTEKKSAASAENGKLGGRPVKAISDVPCNCAGGDSMDHRSTCPRGRLIRQRRKAAAAAQGESNASS